MRIHRCLHCAAIYRSRALPIRITGVRGCLRLPIRSGIRHAELVLWLRQTERPLAPVNSWLPAAQIGSAPLVALFLPAQAIGGHRWMTLCGAGRSATTAEFAPAGAAGSQ